MSFELMSAAVAVDLPCNHKMVLLMLANRTHSDMGYCYPSIKRLAQDCGLSETATKNAIKALVAAGLLQVTAQSKDGIKIPNRYTLLLNGKANPDGRETPIDRRQTPEGGSPDAGGVGRQTPIKQEGKPISETVIPPISPKQSGKVLEVPSEVDPQVWSDFLEHRKKKNAPLTATALRLIKGEAKKAGITLEAALEETCARGWTGFKADWLANKSTKQKSGKHSGFTDLDYTQGVNDDGSF